MTRAERSLVRRLTDAAKAGTLFGPVRRRGGPRMPVRAMRVQVRADLWHRAVAGSAVVRLPHTEASTLHAMPPLPLVDVEVIAAQQVAVDTASLSSLTRRWALTAQQVRSNRHGFQVPRIAARSITTQMVERQAIRHLTAEHDICRAVRVEHRPMLTKPRLAVSGLAIDGSGVDPTHGTIRLRRQKAFQYRRAMMSCSHPSIYCNARLGAST